MRTMLQVLPRFRACTNLAYLSADLVAQSRQRLLPAERGKHIENAGRVVVPVSAARRGCASLPSLSPLLRQISDRRLERRRRPFGSPPSTGSSLQHRARLIGQDCAALSSIASGRAANRNARRS